ncbi:MAG TPA: efflux RND transporter periplasmic adaptor subunit [Candidatus Dormibacteraeota bacterium]|nr:efflux RND transporter periplasmic adaptor subunit [Candidatus Dormibacteraeota bacterium]
MSTKSKVLTVLVLGAANLAIGCGDAKSEGTAVPAPAPVATATPSPTVNTPSVVAAPEDGVTASGPLIVEHQLEIAAQTPGVISKVYVEAGTRVKAGTLLAQIDDRQVTANLEAARAKTRSIENDLKNWQAESEVLKADYVRAQKGYDQGVIPEEQLQHAKFKAESEGWDIKRVTELLNTSKQEERSLELEMEKNRITAPFESLVARRYVREGQSVGRGERLFWVTAEAPLLLRFTLPEKFLGRIKIGQQLSLTSSDVPNEQHTARIKEVSQVVDPSSGTFDVLAELQGSRGELRPGMTASIKLDAPH